MASDFSVCCRWLRACVDGSRAGICRFLFTWQLQFVTVPLTQDVPFRNLQLPRGLKKNTGPGSSGGAFVRLHT